MWGGVLIDPMENAREDVNAVRSRYVEMSRPQPPQEPGKGTVYYWKSTRKNKNGDVFEKWVSDLYADRGTVSLPDGSKYKVSTHDKWTWTEILGEEGEEAMEQLEGYRRDEEVANEMEGYRRAGEGDDEERDLDEERAIQELMDRDNEDRRERQMNGGKWDGIWAKIMSGGFINREQLLDSTVDQVRREYVTTPYINPLANEPGKGTVNISKNTRLQNGEFVETWTSVLNADRGMEEARGKPFKVHETETWTFKEIIDDKEDEGDEGDGGPPGDRLLRRKKPRKKKKPDEERRPRKRRRQGRSAAEEDPADLELPDPPREPGRRRPESAREEAERRYRERPLSPPPPSPPRPPEPTIPMLHIAAPEGYTTLYNNIERANERRVHAAIDDDYTERWRERVTGIYDRMLRENPEAKTTHLDDFLDRFRYELVAREMNERYQTLIDEEIKRRLAERDHPAWAIAGVWRELAKHNAERYKQLNDALEAERPADYARWFRSMDDYISSGRASRT